MHGQARASETWVQILTPPCCQLHDLGQVLAFPEFQPHIHKARNSGCLSREQDGDRPHSGALHAVAPSPDHSPCPVWSAAAPPADPGHSRCTWPVLWSRRVETHTCPPGELETRGDRSRRQDEDSGVGAPSCRGRRGTWGLPSAPSTGCVLWWGWGRGGKVGARSACVLPGLPTPTCTILLAQQGLWKGGSTGQCHSRPKIGTLAAPKGTAAVLALWRAELLGTEASGAWRVRTQVRMSAPPWGGLHR